MNRMAKCALALVLLLVMTMASAAAANVEVSTAAELNDAIKNAAAGETVKLGSDITISQTLTIDKKITLDLGGNTLNINTGWGGISAKNDCTICNGVINYNGNVAAIRAWNVAAIEGLTINVKAKDAGKTTGGIVVQNVPTNCIGLIKNVTIKGPTNGIETYNCGDAANPVITKMENVVIDAEQTGMLLSAPCGTATNCTIYGGKHGINMHLKGTYSVTLTLKDSDVKGGETAVYIWDEESRDPDKFNNTGIIELNADNETTYSSENGGAPIKSVVYDENKFEAEAAFSGNTGICISEINGVKNYYESHSWKTNSNNSKECENCGRLILPMATLIPANTPIPDTSDMPQTGDNSNIALYALLLTMSAAGMLLLMRRKGAQE